jgi:hypothetical protein
LTLALARGQLSALFRGGRDPGAHGIGVWMGHSAGLDDVEKRKFLTLLRLEL